MTAEKLLDMLTVLDYTYRIVKYLKEKMQHRIKVIILTKDKRAKVKHTDDRKEFFIWNKGAYLLEKSCINKVFNENSEYEGRMIVFFEGNSIPLCVDKKMEKKMEQKISSIVKEYERTQKGAKNA